MIIERPPFALQCQQLSKRIRALGVATAEYCEEVRLLRQPGRGFGPAERHRFAAISKAWKCQYDSLRAELNDL